MRYVHVWCALALICGLACSGSSDPQDLLSRAQSAIASKDTKLAADLYDEVLNRFPLSAAAPEAALRRAYVAIKLGEPQTSTHLRKSE